MRQWILTQKEIITVSEDAKEDFKKMMGWTEKEFNIHTFELLKPNKKLQKLIDEGIEL